MIITLHTQNSSKNREMNSLGAPEGYEVPFPIVIPVVASMNVYCMLLYKATFFVEPCVSSTGYWYVHSDSFHYVSSASFQYDLTVSFRISHL